MCGPGAARGSRRATVLIAVLCALIMLGVVVVGVVYLGAMDQDLTVLRMESAQSLYAADAAANMALQEIAVGSDLDGDGVVGSVGSGVAASGQQLTGGSTSAQSAAAVSVAGGVYTVTATGSTTRAAHAHQLRVSRSGSYQGLYAQCFTLSGGPGSCYNINWSATPGWATVVPNVEMPWAAWDLAYWIGGPPNYYAIRYQGYITIPSSGTWTFYLYADDGAILSINGSVVVDNDGDHGPYTKSASVVLSKGTYPFDLKYYEAAGETVVQASWSGPGVATQTIIPSSAFTCGATVTPPPILGTTSVTLNGTAASYIDGFDARNGVYGGSNIITSGFAVATNSTAAGAISVTGSTLKGNAVCGVGGTPSTVITKGVGGTITGLSSAATIGTAVMIIGTPSGMPSSIGDQTFSGTITINSNYHVNNMTVSSGTITISGNVVGQIDGNFLMSGSASMVVLAGSTLTLYVGGTFTMQNTSTLNISAGDPRSVKIYMIGSAKEMTLSGSAKCCAYTRNNAGGLSVVGGSTPAPAYYGVFQGTTVSLTGNGLIHADVSVGTTTGSGMGTSMTQWMQVK